MSFLPRHNCSVAGAADPLQDLVVALGAPLHRQPLAFASRRLPSPRPYAAGTAPCRWAAPLTARPRSSPPAPKPAPSGHVSMYVDAGEVSKRLALAAAEGGIEGPAVPPKKVPSAADLG